MQWKKKWGKEMGFEYDISQLKQMKHNSLFSFHTHTEKKNWREKQKLKIKDRMWKEQNYKPVGRYYSCHLVNKYETCFSFVAFFLSCVLCVHELLTATLNEYASVVSHTLVTLRSNIQRTFHYSVVAFKFFVNTEFVITWSVGEAMTWNARNE